MPDAPAGDALTEARREVTRLRQDIEDEIREAIRPLAAYESEMAEAAIGVRLDDLLAAARAEGAAEALENAAKAAQYEKGWASITQPVACSKSWEPEGEWWARWLRARSPSSGTEAP